MPVRAVGFDLDDTLVVPETDREAILRQAAREAGLPGSESFDRADYLRAHGRVEAAETREPVFANLVDGDADPAAAATAYREATNEALVPVPGAAALLRELRRDYAVGLLTDGPIRAQRSKLETLGWTDLFDAVVITGDVGARKPNERAFETLLREFGVAPEEAVYVGDHPERDVRGAADAGLRTVQVLGAADEPQPGADVHVRRDELGEELPGILASLA